MLRQKKFVWAVVAFCFWLPLSANAQDTLLATYLQTWNVADTSQFWQAQVLYNKLHEQNDSVRFDNIIQKLHAYLADHPDKRIEARTILFETLGTIELHRDYKPYVKKLQHAIKLAYDLDDLMLTAEVYCLLADIIGDSGYFLYNLKAIEIQEKIGVACFPFAYARYFDVSRALYQNHEYHQSIAYGRKGLQLLRKEKQYHDARMLIFQLDILGANYKMLGEYDSSGYYYRQLETLVPVTRMPPPEKAIWDGIAKGNIGYTLAQHHQFEQAIPLLQTYIQNSTELADWVNMALSNNALAACYELQGKLSLARPLWRQAYHVATQANARDPKADAAKGLATNFRQAGKTDSAFYYYDEYHALKDTIAQIVSHRRLSVMQARIDFDELQASLEKAERDLIAMHNLRDRMLLIVAVVAVLALWMYNRYRLKQKYALQLMARKQEQAMEEIQKARAQMAAMATQIAERSQLVKTLKKRITAQVKDVNPDELTRCLGEYTLFSDEDWERFKADFTQAYPEFLPILREQASQITPAEERLAILLFLRLSSEQIANTLGISKKSVARSKRRLKKRLLLSEAYTVEEFIYNLLNKGG